MDTNETCGGCGSIVRAEEYHPYAACRIIKSGISPATMRANLQAVVEYGMKAQRKGVDIEAAMNNISLVHTS